MKVLVIDDDKAIRDLIKMILSSEDCNVIEADNGKVGLAKVRDEMPDMVICDLIMPVQEGMETITKICEDYPEIKVVAISGGGRIEADSYLSIAKTLGAWKIFSKPIDGEELIKTLIEVKRLKE